jgi:protein disulfide-isomerase
MKIWIRNSSGDQTPYDLEKLGKEVRDNKINPETTYCWHEGLTEWVPATKILPPPFETKTNAQFSSNIKSYINNNNRYSKKAVLAFVFILLQVVFLCLKSPIWIVFLISAIIFGILAAVDLKKNNNLKGIALLNTARIIFWIQLLLVIIVLFKLFLMPIFGKVSEIKKNQISDTNSITNKNQMESSNNTSFEQQTNVVDLINNSTNSVECTTNASLWGDNYRLAVQKSGDMNRNLLLYIHAGWSSWCQELDAELFSSKEFADYASNNLVLIKLEYNYRKYPDAETRMVRKIYEVQGFPALILLSPDHQILKKHIGYIKNGFDGFKQWMADGTDNDYSTANTPISVWESNVTNFDSVNITK